MKVVVIGAGFSGITTARTLVELGHEIVVFEKCADVGGVWSSSRQYPGVATQNTSDTYYLSDMPMPSRYPVWPSGAQVQSYLESYVDKHQLAQHIRLSTEVVEMSRAASSGHKWYVRVRGPGGETMHDADHVVICNGIFCEGAVPHYPGVEEYDKMGGRVCHTSDVRNAQEAAGKHVVVVGYGKSANDVANALSLATDTDGQPLVKSTTVVARRLLWKLPRKIRGLNYKWLLLTRFGEALFPYIKPSSAIESFLHRGVGLSIRNFIVGSLEAVVKGQLKLAKLGLVPDGSFEQIARSTISLSTEGFYDGIQDGRLQVRRDVSIVGLGARSKSSHELSASLSVATSSADTEREIGAMLSDGTFVRADIIIAGTGFQQQPPKFLPADVAETLVDSATGDWLLYSHIKPLSPLADGITFNGYNSTLFCATSSEVGALWIGAYLSRGDNWLPPADEQERVTREKVKWMRERSMGKHARATNLVPFSLHQVDDTLREVGVDIGMFSKAAREN